MRRFLEPCDLEIWRMTLKNNRAPLLSNIKLYASFHHHMWIQTGVTVRKRLSWVVTSVTLTFDLWPWPFAWTLRWSLVITPENFMMIRWWEHSQKGVTDRRTDRRTDGQTENTICRAAWSQLKILRNILLIISCLIILMSYYITNLTSIAMAKIIFNNIKQLTHIQKMCWTEIASFPSVIRCYECRWFWKYFLCVCEYPW